ncbi:hypothetical protein JMJ35_004523 [Cladonia borealis]|uniref:Uncharacterized protein n=1 Tax=Cladonia borealis TaxID=184061 RepID=A0AA39R1V0_9LECA|nr:hypothetical protein JMJ35_004523 [Cladonia borealis]
MARPDSPNDCHKPQTYTAGDEIWYLRYGSWRKGKVKEIDGSSDGAKRYLVRNCSKSREPLADGLKVTDSDDNRDYHKAKDDVRKQGAE